MCLSKAYIEKNGDKELMMEEITSVEIEDNKLLFTTLFGEQKEVEANLRKIDFMTHSILLKDLKERSVSSKRS